MAKEKNPLCASCKREIDLEELSLIEQAEALEGNYTHPDCSTKALWSKEKQAPEMTKFRHLKS